jgi:hypothetical protein
MLNKYTVTLTLLTLIGGIVPAFAPPAGAPLPVIGVGAVGFAAVSGAVVVARLLLKR